MLSSQGFLHSGEAPLFLLSLIPATLHGLLVLFTPTAMADCPTAYTGSALVKDLGSVQSALRNLDDSAFAASGKSLEAGLPCLDMTAPPQLFASAYRYLGAVHYLVENDPEGARRWFRASLELDPTYQWDAQELDLGNPMRAVYEAERPNAPIPGDRVAGKDLDVPSGSAFLLDGRPLVEPRATPGRPHVVQVAVIGSRHADHTWLIDGNAFPDDTLRVPPPVVAVVEDPKKAKKVEAKPEPKPEPKVESKPVAKTEPKPESKPKSAAATTTAVTGEDGVQHMVVKRTRPPEKTPLMIVGAVGLAGAVGLYAYSWKLDQDFNAATTTDELEKLQAQNHAFVIASGASLLVGAGIGYWGVILDGNTVGFRVGGRF